MSLCDGDINQYHELMRSSVDDFLIKLEYKVQDILREQPEQEVIEENG